MKVIGFNFTKIKAEKSKSNLDQLKINAKMDILSIESLKSNLLNTEEDILGVEFAYSLQYEPDFGKIELEGNVLFSMDSKIAKEISKEWKDKKMPEEFKILLFNIILRKSNLKALELEEEIGLPPHLQLPSFKKGNNQEKKED